LSCIPVENVLTFHGCELQFHEGLQVLLLVCPGHIRSKEYFFVAMVSYDAEHLSGIDMPDGERSIQIDIPAHQGTFYLIIEQIASHMCEHDFVRADIIQHPGDRPGSCMDGAGGGGIVTSVDGDDQIQLAGPGDNALVTDI